MGLRKDYHGSRSYSADPPADEGHPPSTLMGRLKSIFRPKSWPLREPDGRTFSLLGDDEPQHYHTLGGLAMLALGRVPHTGDVFERSGYRFEIVDMDGNRVDRLLVSPLRHDGSIPGAG